MQKLQYIQFNSVRTDELDYNYFSAMFYQTVLDEFDFLSKLYQVFGRH